MKSAAPVPPTTSVMSPNVSLGSIIFIVFFLLILAIVLIFIASGFDIFDEFFKKLKHLFTFPSFVSKKPSDSELLIPPSYFSEIKQNLGMKEDSESDSDSEMEFELKESSPTTGITKSSEKPTPPNHDKDLEVEMVKSVPVPMQPSFKNRSLDNAIETSLKYSTTPTSKKESFTPIDEEGLASDTNGWCFIGESKGSRGCAPVGKLDKCITGEVYVNQMECLKIHPDDAPIPK